MTEDAFKGRVLVLGGRGMLGRQVTRAAREKGYQVWASGSEIDISNPLFMAHLEKEIHPHYVVNCAGIIPEKLNPFTTETDMVRVNALGPWVAREAFKLACFVQVSTDCVLTPYDTYSKSKLMGEVPLYFINGRTFVVRTSFIGYEHGLLSWLLQQPRQSEVRGWTEAKWSGSTVYDVADGLIKLFDEAESQNVVLAAPTITKYELLDQLNFMLDLGLRVIPTAHPRVDRSMQATHLIDRNLTRLVAMRPVGLAV